MMLAVTSDDQILLRDGRPFGGEGSFGGTSLTWPQPQTLAGMIRTHIGFARSPGYFHDEARAKEILKVGIARMLPAMIQRNSWLAWTPADMVFSEKDDLLTAHLPTYRQLAEGEGSDLPWREWFHPFPGLKAKPSSKRPNLLHWSVIEAYLKGRIPKPAKDEEWGILSIPVDSRIHNGLSRETGTTIQGRLFENKGIHLKIKSAKKNGIEDLAIVFELVGHDNGDKPEGSAHLGGDRNTVRISASSLEYPSCPDIFSGCQYLKLVLMTPGDFGSWAPSWILPDGATRELSWVCIPGTSYEVRLRSAMLAGWDGVSGWDYLSNKPKAMRKTVRAGSVYVIEVRDPGQAQKIAAHFWGSAFDPDPLRTADGYGQVIVARMADTKN